MGSLLRLYVVTRNNDAAWALVLCCVVLCCVIIFKPQCTCAARAYGSHPVCVSVCYSNICSTAAFWLKIR